MGRRIILSIYAKIKKEERRAVLWTAAVNEAWIMVFFYAVRLAVVGDTVSSTVLFSVLFGG